MTRQFVEQRQSTRVVRLTMLVSVAAFAALAFASAASRAAQSDGPLPTAKEVLDRNVEATGGREALLKHKSITMHGRVEVPSKGVASDVVSYTEDGKQFQKAMMADGRQQESGYDGVVSWSMDENGKVSLDEGDIVKTVARDADMYYHLHVLDYFRSMEVVDVSDFHGHTCYHLKGTNNWGQPNEQFYDRESGLLIGYAFDTKWRGGDGPATEYFEDYKSFEGVLMPVKTTHTEGGRSAIITMTSATFDDVDDAVFALPDAVKEAVNKRASHSLK